MLFDIDNPIADWLFPRRCLVCMADIALGDLCESCRSFCHRCPETFDSDQYWAIFLFELTVKELIKNAKFNKNIPQMYVLYNLLAEEIKEEIIDKIKMFSPEVITFVPNHWLHRVTRGSELPAFFAGILSSKLKISVISMLKKTSFLNRQALLKSKKERQTSIKGSFALKKGLPDFSRILLVDDIVTTGATFNELKRVLGENRDIRCIAIAKTP